MFQNETFIILIFFPTTSQNISWIFKIHFIMDGTILIKGIAQASENSVS